MTNRMLWCPPYLPPLGSPGRAEFCGLLASDLARSTPGRTLAVFGSDGALHKARSVLTGQEPEVLHEGMKPCGGERLAFEQQDKALMVCGRSWLRKNPVQELGLSCLVLDQLPVTRLPGLRGRPFVGYDLYGERLGDTALMRAVDSLACLADALFADAWPGHRVVLAVLDGRLVDSAYRHHFSQVLPGTTLGRDLGDLDAFFRQGRRGTGSTDVR